MRKWCWIKLLVDYDCEISYQSENENMVVDVLSHKEPTSSYYLKYMSLVVVLDIFLVDPSCSGRRFERRLDEG